MPDSSSTTGSRSTYRCGVHELSDVDSETLASAESRAQEQHERRLARIVADQWMHVARKRLTLAWCAQMMCCWRKICSDSIWTRQQEYLASEHHTRKKFLKTFNAFREGSRTKRRKQSIAAEFHKENLEKKALFSLSKAQFNYWRHHDQQYLAKAFRAVKRYHEKKKMTKRIYGGAQSVYGTSLKMQALRGLSKHREHLKLKSSRQAAASYHWKKHMKARILRCWGIIAKRISELKNKGDKSRILLLQALLKRCMKNWLLVTNETVHARQKKVAQASQTFNKSRKKRMLRAWAQRSREKQSRRLKLEQAAAMHSDRTSAAVTSAWRNYAIQKEEGRAKTSMAFSFRRKQALSDAIAVWKAYQAKKEKAGNAALKALAHLKRNLTQKSMAAWKPWHEKRTSKKQDREKALEIYKYRLQRWACERILAVGLMLQALRLQSREGGQSMSSKSSYLKVAPYARKWWFISQRRSNLRKALLDLQRKEEGSQTQKEEVPISNNKEPFMHEVLLRIGIDKDGQTLKIQHERPASPLHEMTNAPHERPQPRGRSLLPPSPIPAQPSGIPPSPVVRQRPAPRRPAFLSFPIS
ncbi:hypothetical protein M758_12G164500 [Ceratodon purpureus]|uniref:Sfi1 spindle body domain-containing protein n=1 Tax=Ceratodon purpureus TaxID=3225 RepID=A0A8T0GBJ0_CERPU|nr:hypothetical protein KC19_12G162200 [Ceratodon purpureus]KAG0599597.1 hypothetical protein M758_12G164500 [Ceratodon purpureus]